MKLSEIIENSKKKSEDQLKEIREQLSIPFFRTKEQALWDGSAQKNCCYRLRDRRDGLRRFLCKDRT